MKRAKPPVVQDFSAPGFGGWLHALGWLAVFGVLHMRLDISALSTVCLTLVLAELLSSASLSGVHPQNPTRNWQDLLCHILCRWMAMSFLIVAMPVIWPQPFFHAQPFAVVCLIGLSLALAVLKLFDALTNQSGGPWSRFLQLRMLLSAMSLLVISRFGTLHADIALLSVLLTYLALLISPLIRALPPSGATAGISINSGQSLNSLAPLISQNLDLVVVPFLFPPEPVLHYLTARGLVQIVPLTSQHLLALAYPGLLLARKSTYGCAFTQTAARLNLGLLLVGGAAGLFAMACLEIGQSWSIGRSIAVDGLFYWLLIGACAPVLFGATQVLSSVAQMRRDATLVHLAGIIAFFVILKGTRDITPPECARIFAVLQLMTSASVAGLLAYREGIWPGLTALFFRQIRLLGR